MLIGLGALFIGLFVLLGGPKNDLLLTQVDNYAKKEILDKDRKTIVLTEIKAVKEIQKEYKKNTKKNKKELEQLVNNHATSIADFKDYYSSLVDYEEKINEQLIPHRLLIQNTFTQAEWDNVLLDAKKDIKKNEKSVQKQLEKWRKTLDQSERNILKVVAEDQKGRATEVLADFNKGLYKFGEEILTYDPTEKELLTNKNATKDDLLKVCDHDIQQWIEILDQFAELHVELAKIVPENDWKAVAKELNKF